MVYVDKCPCTLTMKVYMRIGQLLGTFHIYYIHMYVHVENLLIALFTSSILSDVLPT